jgi:hypothetical protein
MNEEIVAGDFVIRRRTVGLVQKIEDGHAYVWWHDRDKPGGRAQTLEQRHPISELEIAGAANHIPASMIILRQEKFGNKAFRLRER